MELHPSFQQCPVALIPSWEVVSSSLQTPLLEALQVLLIPRARLVVLCRFLVLLDRFQISAFLIVEYQL